MKDDRTGLLTARSPSVLGFLDYTAILSLGNSPVDLA